MILRIVSVERNSFLSVPKVSRSFVAIGESASDDLVVLGGKHLYHVYPHRRFGTEEGPPRDMGFFEEYRVGDRGFFAILGSPNGSGVVRMLTDHCNAFRKTIISVRVLNPLLPPMHPTFYFVLADYPLVSKVPTKRAKNTISTAGQKRKRQRLLASLLSCEDTHRRRSIWGGSFVQLVSDRSNMSGVALLRNGVGVCDGSIVQGLFGALSRRGEQIRLYISTWCSLGACDFMQVAE